MKKIKRTKSKSSNLEFINSIPSMRDEELDSLAITFVNENKSRQIVKCNKSFFTSEKGKRLTATQIIKKINTIQHDYCAKYYVIS